ncbi:uncharacterized protein [Miscanthus floridulus]|uniref:uncharacterized protein n=1 Tax=Miscanthus floridulus TaxID=154761 RepID=UPI00345ACFF4
MVYRNGTGMIHSLQLCISGQKQNAWCKYREYTNGLDVLTQHQVFWCLWNSPELQDYLSPVTRDESHEYRCDVPLILFHVVEIHLPIWVCRQFRRMTGCPPPLYSTNQVLHGFDRRKRYKTKD